MAATATSKNIGDRLIAIAKKKSETPDNALNIFLDHCIKAFDISKAQNNDDYNSWVKDVLSTDSDRDNNRVDGTGQQKPKTWRALRLLRGDIRGDVPV